MLVHRCTGAKVRGTLAPAPSRPLAPSHPGLTSSRPLVPYNRRVGDAVTTSSEAAESKAAGKSHHNRD